MFIYPIRIDDLLELIFSLNAFDKYYIHAQLDRIAWRACWFLI